MLTIKHGGSTVLNVCLNISVTDEWLRGTLNRTTFKILDMKINKNNSKHNKNRLGVLKSHVPENRPISFDERYKFCQQ